MVTHKNRKDKLDFVREHLNKLKRARTIQKKNLESKISSYQNSVQNNNDNNNNYIQIKWKETVCDSTTLPAKCATGGVVLWACMVASATGPLVFVYDVSADSRLDCDVARAMLSARIQPNAAELMRRRFSVQVDKDQSVTWLFEPLNMGDYK